MASLAICHSSWRGFRPQRLRANPRLCIGLRSRSTSVFGDAGPARPGGLQSRFCLLSRLPDCTRSDCGAWAVKRTCDAIERRRWRNGPHGDPARQWLHHFGNVVCGGGHRARASRSSASDRQCMVLGCRRVGLPVWSHPLACSGRDICSTVARPESPLPRHFSVRLPGRSTSVIFISKFFPNGYSAPED